MLISDQYRALNRDLHQKANYGISGHKWAGAVDDLATRIEARTVLDYGCGSGTLKEALEGDRSYAVLEYDPAVPGKEQKPLHADIVVCGDVLEHIEPECLDAVLDDIRDIARGAVFLVVSMRRAKKHFPDGRNVHLIVEPAEWWLPKITDRWRLRMFRDLGGEFVCIGAVK